MQGRLETGNTSCGRLHHMEISKTDAKLLIKYLQDAAAYYRQHATTAKEHNRARLLNNLSNKIRKKHET